MEAYNKINFKVYKKGRKLIHTYLTINGKNLKAEIEMDSVLKASAVEGTFCTAFAKVSIEKKGMDSIYEIFRAVVISEEDYNKILAEKELNLKYLEEGRKDSEIHFISKRVEDFTDIYVTPKGFLDRKTFFSLFCQTELGFYGCYKSKEEIIETLEKAGYKFYKFS